jgi:site-specific DNA recombinase
MNKPSTTTELAEALSVLLGVSEDSESQQAALRYAIYCRKSTDASEKQERSLGDQLQECLEFANRLGLRVVDRIGESASAKDSGNRLKFTKMLDDIRRGKIDGIISWAPDRLARNMKEGGEIIDLLDKDIIKDLKFPHFYFQNDSMGKMLLGIQFVMSKQYSDNLSVNVRRGIKRNIEEGRYISTPKVGYYKDRNQLMRPDGANHALVNEAFRMRLADKSLEEISGYLKKMGFPVDTENTKNRRIKISVKRVSEILKDTVYTGVLVFGDHIVDLTDKYDFVPVVSVDDFMKINNIRSINKDMKLAKVIKPKGSIKADLMRGMVICADCNKPMVASITPKTTKGGKRTNYFYYRCATKKCPRQGKSVRAKLVIDAAIAFLENHPLNSIEAFEHYQKEMRKVLAERAKKNREELRMISSRLQAVETRIANTKDYLLKEKDEEFSQTFRTDLKANQDELNRLLLAQQEKRGSRKTPRG